MDVITTTGLSAASALTGVEVVERKGAGHPDTLADGVAEAISRAYSRYCLEEFGAILHHNTDKTSLLGGAANVRFGHGELTAPIQVLVNGRITAALGDHTIPVADLVTTAARDYFASALPLLAPPAPPRSPGRIPAPAGRTDRRRPCCPTWKRPSRTGSRSSRTCRRRPRT
ncbi:methionine adenosyltransferase [Streptomyces sp. NPDC057456]|uniref:methionine adenosyltransferase n=1 Tax=Streptomyces sp. NPDC057456 TaxID=3346139 RepID=UPI0036A23509